MASAAASFISSVIYVARPSSAPLKIPGNAITLLTWFGKSERPVPTTFAPAAFATSGIISGTCHGKDNRIFVFMDEPFQELQYSEQKHRQKYQHPLKHPPVNRSYVQQFVTSIMDSCIQFKPSLPLERIPDLSHMVTCLNPYVRSNAGRTGTVYNNLTSSFVFPVTFKPLIIPASTTIAAAAVIVENRNV